MIDTGRKRWNERGPIAICLSEIASVKSLWSQCPSASCNEFTSTLNNRDNKRDERAVGDGGENGERKGRGGGEMCEGDGHRRESGRQRDCILIGWKCGRWIGDQNVIIDVRHQLQAAASSSVFKLLQGISVFNLQLENIEFFAQLVRLS